MISARKQKVRERKIREVLSLTPAQGFCQGASITHGLVEGAESYDMNAHLGRVGYLAPVEGSSHIKALVGMI